MSPEPAPLSKTAKYKKITKPLLERKRRARINRCLDELKDLMVGALEIDDDNLSKLEKADILELTVNHLTKLHRPKDPVIEAKKFQAGFGQCAAEACKFIMSIPELDSKVSQNLVGHLSRLISTQPLTIQVPERPSFSPPGSPSSVLSDRQNYYSDQERSSSDAEDSVYSSETTSRHGSYSRNSRPPMTGLLTTVDKVPPHHNEQGTINGNRNSYFNRVPIEAKDLILQKIRQHIMDKRGNDYIANEVQHHDTINESNSYDDSLHRDDSFPISSPDYVNDTLDLRKYRSPTKPTADTRPMSSRSPTFPRSETIETVPERKVEVTPTVPERCQMTMEYSNLPPKKKRKLIEYQEYKKQEEAQRQMKALCVTQPERLTDRPPTEHDRNEKLTEYHQVKKQGNLRHKLCSVYANQMEPLSGHDEWSEQEAYAYYARQRSHHRDRPPASNEVGENKWRPW